MKTHHNPSQPITTHGWVLRSLVPIMNANLITALDTFDNELQKKDNVFMPLKKAISVCLKPNRFYEHQNDIISLREALRKLVVDPIQQVYMVAWEHPVASTVHPIVLGNSENRQVNPQLPPPGPSIEPPSSCFECQGHHVQQEPFLQHSHVRK
jgi:hypothetical protein